MPEDALGDLGVVAVGALRRHLPCDLGDGVAQRAAPDPAVNALEVERRLDRGDLQVAQVVHAPVPVPESLSVFQRVDRSSVEQRPQPLERRPSALTRGMRLGHDATSLFGRLTGRPGTWR